MLSNDITMIRLWNDMTIRCLWKNMTRLCLWNDMTVAHLWNDMTIICLRMISHDIPVIQHDYKMIHECYDTCYDVMYLQYEKCYGITCLTTSYMMLHDMLMIWYMYDMTGCMIEWHTTKCVGIMHHSNLCLKVMKKIIWYERKKNGMSCLTW